MSAGLYMQAVSSGIEAISLATGGDNAATIAAYNESYNAQYRRYAALDTKNTAESNISAISQDKILSNLNIQMNQQQAKAAAQVSAAVAGVSGSSIDAGMYQIDANASMQVARVDAQAEQLTEQQLAIVGGAQTNLNSVPKPSSPNALQGALTGVTQAIGSLNEEDFTNLEAQLWSD